MTAEHSIAREASVNFDPMATGRALMPRRLRLAVGCFLGLVAMLPTGCAALRSPPPAAEFQATPLPEPSGDDLAEFERMGHSLVEQEEPVDAPPVILQGAVVLTAHGERYDPGYIVIRNGRIAALGEGAPPKVDDAHLIDVSGDYITPGIIDVHSHLGVYPTPWAQAHNDGNEATDPNTAGVWAEHGFWPQDPSLERAMAGGVTTVQILPGSANLIGGRGVTLHLVPHRGARAMRFPGAPEGVKMACGENPKRVYGKRNETPATRMGNVREQRAAFIEARAYRDAWRRYRRDVEKAERGAPGAKSLNELQPPKRDLNKETLVQLMEGRLLAHIHCYRADDMLNLIQLADEFGFSIRAFHHALEAYKIADILADRGIAAATWADWWGFKLEAFDGIPQNAGLVTRAGGRAIIHSDSHTEIRRLNQEAAKAYYAALHAGLTLTEDEALRWITANPAWALGIEDQVGSLQPGLRADIVVWDRHPFSVYARARYVFVDGVPRFDREHPGAPWSDFELGLEVSP